MLGSDFSKGTSATFTDGKVRGIQIRDGKILKNLTDMIPVGIKTVGFNRYFRSLNQDIKISKVVVMPFEAPIDDSVYLELFMFRQKGAQIYKIVQLQELADSKPPCLQLSLEKVRTNFTDLRKVGV